VGFDRGRFLELGVCVEVATNSVGTRFTVRVIEYERME